MSVELPTAANSEAVESAVLEAEFARRENAARYLSLAMGLLGLPATLAAMRGLSEVWQLLLCSTILIFGIYALSFTRWRRHCAGLLMGTMLVEHILVVQQTPSEVFSPTPYFTSIVIFIATTTTGYRGVLTAIGATFGTLVLITYLRLQHISGPQVHLELPVPFLLALTIGTVAVVQSREARRALRVLIARERELQLARQQIKDSYEEKLRLSQELENSRRLESLGRLAGTVAHDFNNLLTVVAGSAEIAQRTSDPALVQQELNVILELVDKSSALNRQLLTFGKRMAQRLEALELSEAIEQLRPLLQRAAGDHVMVRFSRAPEPLSVMADRSQLEQVLMNLVVNAREALRESELESLAVSLTLSEVDSGTGDKKRRCAVLEVSDNGPGMSEEVSQRIFEPYFTTKSDERGTGLGLSTVYGIVNRWGGSIEVDSAVGLGTTFTIQIPLIEPD